MGNKTIRLDGKKHSMLREFVEAFEYLESIEGVESVHFGRFAEKGIKNTGRCYSIKYYNETTRTMKLEVRTRQRTQKNFLELYPEKREYVESKINNISMFL